MTNFEIANQMTDVMGLFLEGFAVMATLIFAYVTGAFYFLHRAPIFTKIISYGFLIFSILFLMVNVLGTFFHFMALIDQVDEKVADGSASYLIEATQSGRTRILSTLGFWTFVPVLFGTLIMCFWMTFIWRGESQEDLPPHSN